MNEVSRRSLLGGAVVAATSALWDEPAHAQYVWQKADWQVGDFETLTRLPRRIKQVIHAREIGDGRFLSMVKNSMNGVILGSGIARAQVQIVCAMNGPANTLNYSDYVWQKYRLGERMKIADPKTGEHATRNIFYPSKAGPSLHYSSLDPSSEDSAIQDPSIQGLQARGVRFLSCHTSTEELARALVKQNNLSEQPEDVVKDIQAHMLPGVLIVPALSAALALLQCDGHYAYISTG